ncbi:DUF882 domain-containing protein [Chelatococcus reniformis]|uniref:DUF882 domain-containing protein n=1 Tax=Chelatococcus reniformis TaxID=1494448 RepID=UPI001FCE92D4|nr:DUF882 domain-containing protein [Chelatococcus reniformis]
MTETQNAVANGDTRTLTIYHTHTKEAATVTFKRYGSYDRQALKQLYWLLRDWRRDEPTNMDPKLFDLVWEVYRETGSREAIHVVSAYRSPTTNAMLRRRSRAVAEHSQHMLGKAMDFYLPDVRVDRVRAIGVRLQRGGVGYYPTAYNPFIHLDVASVRAWPRMTHDQLAQLFPDGKTVHVPSDGRPLAGYEQARAEVLARGGTVAGYTAFADSGESAAPRKSFWAMLFGGADESEDVAESRVAPAPQPTRVRSARAVEKTAQQVAYAPANATGGDAGLLGFVSANPQQAPAPAEAAGPSPRSLAALQRTETRRTAEAGQIVAEASQDQQAAAAPAPASATPALAPLPVARPAAQEPEPASPALAPLPVARPAQEPAAQPEQAAEPVAVASMPLPPPRPTDLGSSGAAAFAMAPLPPVRPTDAGNAHSRPDDGSAAALAALAAGAAASDAKPGSALAYASPSAPLPPGGPVARPPVSVRPLAAAAPPLPTRLAAAYSSATFASDTVRAGEPTAKQANGLTAAALIAASRPNGSAVEAPARSAPITFSGPRTPATQPPTSIPAILGGDGAAAAFNGR